MLPELGDREDVEDLISEKTDALLDTHRQSIYRRTDRLFAALMGIQWVAGVIAAVWISPRTWSGASSAVHLHVWAAVFLGGLLCGLPIYLAVFHPGKATTRYTIALCQALMSALLIHLSGGRIETHFHIFGSLAFLACYRDWRVLGVATVVVAVDHWVRGVYWPESVYGVLTTSSWRFLEHAGWVVFEDTFLVITIRQSLGEMKRMAGQRARLEATNEIIEDKVKRRTKELDKALAETAWANRELEAAVKDLEEKNRELDEFTYVASHDLQEPVRKLVSFSSLLREDVGEALNERAEKDLGFITNAARRMQNLVQDLLALSRAGRSALSMKQLSLDACATRALESLQLSLEETGAELRRDPLPEVIGDSTLFTQLYQNLLSNALKFVDGQKPRIHLTAEAEGDTWVLGVRDNGIGMKPEYSERIFAPFQRLHGRGEYEGTGIGLAICKKAVQRHGGRIWVESEPGQGSHFKFTLPRVPEREAAVEPAQVGEEKIPG